EVHYLLALMTRDLDLYNQVIDTVDVYDLISGEVILSKSVTYDLDADYWIELDVEIDYPILKVSTVTHSVNNPSPSKEVSYYFAKKGSEMICSSVDDTYRRTDYGNGLSAIRMDGDIYWINRDMEIIQTVDKIVASEYDVQLRDPEGKKVFRSEFQGYLYAWNRHIVQVFNDLGICSGEYRIAHEGELSAFVLDNGNVLIQDFEKVGDDRACNVILDNVRYVLKSYIMNLVDGSLTPVELNFIVDTLETSYVQRNHEDQDRLPDDVTRAPIATNGGTLPFALASGRKNQAIIYRFADGNVSLYQEYVVLDNQLRVEYTVKNSRIGVDFKSAKVVRGDLYSATVTEGGGVQDYLFDLDGNVLTPITPKLWVSESYIITDFAIYTHKMEKVLDLKNGAYAGCYVGVDPVNDRIYLEKHNFTTDGDETYVYTKGATEPVLLCAGVDVTWDKAGNGFYVLKEEESLQYRFCNPAGEIKLIVWNHYTATPFANGLLVETTFEGRAQIFVIR
ncbi:MAG: hypothetical protein IKA76_08570, partial [Clostridia bacterium]|nr:hypothetical protein [Clostridia bacterium]